MDDFNLSSLSESRNEWVARLMNTMCPYIMDGFKAIFTESYKLCVENDENDKYLMTFQNFLSRIPKWNDDLIKTEVDRIVDSSSCGYLEDLITCVHIIQLKALTCIRVGQKQKKIDLDIPKLNDFVHKIYILVARKLYTNIYLFEKDIPPLQMQKNAREFELIVKDSIVDAIRESIPVEQILRSYLDETTEEDVEVEESVVEDTTPIVGDDNTITREVTEIINKVDEDSGIVLKTGDNIQISKDDTPIKLDSIETLVPDTSTDVIPIATVAHDTDATHDTATHDANANDVNATRDVNLSSIITTAPIANNTGISFNNIDTAMSTDGVEQDINAPKSIRRLEEIAEANAERRRLEEMEDLAEDNNEKLTIGAPISLDNMVETLGGHSSSADNNNSMLGDVEVLA